MAVKNSTDITVLIVNTDDLNFLKDCLKSIARQRMENLKLETIIIDNGSTDGSYEYVRKMFPSVKWIQNDTNLLYTKANNRGLKKIKSKYFLILNPDTILPPATLIRMYRFMEKRPDIGMSSCRQTNQWGDVLPICHRFFTPLTQILALPLFYRFAKKSNAFKHFRYADWDRLDSREIDTIPGSFMFGRSKLLRQVGFLDESMPMFYSDDDFCLRIIHAGFKIWYYAPVTITHLTSKTISRSPYHHVIAQGQRDLVSYFKKHYGAVWAFTLFLLTKLSVIASGVSFGLGYLRFTLERILTAYISYRDARRFQQLFPMFTSRLPQIQSRLEPAYQYYVTKVSHPEMAISLELAAFLRAFCEVVKPKTIADLGSGFSSFIFRTYAMANKSVSVYSVDDNKKWLRKTVTFLGKHQLSTAKMSTWSEFQNQKQPFDLVLFDLGNMNIRVETVTNAFSLVKPGGYLVLDDLHFPVYTPHVKHEAKRNGGKLLSLRQFTKDDYGRYAALFYKSNKIVSEVN